MKQIEFYKLAFYLPFNVKVWNFEENVISFDEETDYEKHVNTLCKHSIAYFSEKDKLILKPLIYLTKEIECNGEKFIPILRLLNLERKELKIKEIYHIKNSFNSYSVGVKHHHVKHKDNVCVASLSFGKGNLDTIRFDYIQKLLEWHFDIFDLIDAGLAVDFYSC